MRRKRRAGAKAREMKIKIVTTTWSRELGLELPTPSIMHACLSVRREFRHLLTGLRIRNAGTRESRSHPVPVGPSRRTPRIGVRGSRGHRRRYRPRPATAGSRPRCARGRHVTAAVHPSSSRPGPLIALNTGRLFTAYRHLRWHLRISEGSRCFVAERSWNTRQASYPTCRPLLIVEPSLCL